MHRLNALLDHYLMAPREELPSIEQAVWSNFGVERCVLVLDMSGFSSITRRHGLVHFLSMVRRMQLVTLPIVESHGGQHIKYDADNLFAAFPDTDSALQSAFEIQDAFRKGNELTEDSRDIHVSIGIDKGRILLIPGKDMFGDAVNIAAKLGEDLAERGEILVSAAAVKGIAQAGHWHLDHRSYHVSGLTIEACSVTRASAP